MSGPRPAGSVVAEQRLDRIRRLAFWLDSGIPVPGTRIRIGLDPILGLMPGLGDVAGAVVAATVFREGVRRGVSRATLLRIAANIALDAVAGAVPVLGDLFDFAWKANVRNVALLERYGGDPARARRGDRLFILTVSAALVLACALLLALGVALPVWLFSR